jgi:hypothetical protein
VLDERIPLMDVRLDPVPPGADLPGPDPTAPPPVASDAAPDHRSAPVPGPVPFGRAPARRDVQPDDRSGDQRLLGVLSTLDLGDFPADPQRLRIDPDEAMTRLQRGDWLELIGRDGLPQEVKVAWINTRRTVVLLVRRPDRRALSLRASEMRERFAQHKATLIV